MRPAASACASLLAGIVILALPVPALAQPGGAFQPDGNKSGFNKGGWNKIPEERFKDYAKGKDHLVINEMTGWLRVSMEKYAKEHGISSGKLTLPQYLQYSQALEKQFGKGNPNAGAGPPATGAKVEGSTVGGDTLHTAKLKGGVQYTIYLRTPQAGYDPYLYLFAPDGQLVAKDDDGDGFPNSRIVYTPKVDGEFTLKCSSFGRASSGKYQLSVEGGAVILGAGRLWAVIHSESVVDLSGLNDRPVVYYGSKLPPGLPAWYAELDTDKDGQIGLYEWVASRKTLAEFKAMDRNQDGFLTPDEALYFIHSETDPDAGAAVPDHSGGKTGKGMFGGLNGSPAKPAQ